MIIDERKYAIQSLQKLKRILQNRKEKKKQRFEETLNNYCRLIQQSQNKMRQSK